MSSSDTSPMDQPKDGREARQHKRLDLRAEVTLHGETNFFQGFSENISEGGIFVITHYLEPIGSIVELDILLPGQRREPVTIKGEVCWVRDYDPSNSSVDPGMGLRFLDLSDEDKARIEAFVEQREPIFYDHDDI